MLILVAMVMRSRSSPALGIAATIPPEVSTGATVRLIDAMAFTSRQGDLMRGSMRHPASRSSMMCRRPIPTCSRSGSGPTSSER